MLSPSVPPNLCLLCVASMAISTAAAVAGEPCPPAPPTAGDIPHLRFADLLACPPLNACAADLSGDGAVDVFDLLEYLDGWFAADLTTDLTNDMTVDVFDLLQYLDLWFEGCA